MSGIHSDDMIVRNRELFETGEYTDMTVYCDGGKFRLHRFIMCSASEFFKAAMDEDNFKEGKTGEITLVEDKVEAFKRMLSFLYILDYEDRDGMNYLNMPESICGEDSPPQPSDGVEAEAEADADHARRNVRYNWRQDPSDIERDFWLDSDLNYATPENEVESYERGQAQLRMLNNVDVYAIAEKYNLPALKELAAKKFRRDICKCPLTGLTVIAHKAYTSTPSTDRGIRDLVIQICETNFDQIKDARDIGAVMEANGDFGYDMFKLARGKYKKQLKASEDLQSKVKTKKQKVGRLMKKKRDLSKRLNVQERMITYMKTQHANLTVAHEFASSKMWSFFNFLPSKDKQDCMCAHCGGNSPESVTWEKSGKPPYWLLSCDDCHWRDQEDIKELEMMKAISLQDLDDDWKWQHGRH